MLARDDFNIDSHKLHLHPERVAQWLAAGSDWEKIKNVFPLYVEISPSGACNHRCTFCAVDYIGYEQRQLSLPVLLKALASMGENGVKSVMFAGEGEPLLMKDLGKAINFAKAQGIDVSITTNATPLSDRFVRECLHNVAWIKASVNAGTEDSYAKIHRGRSQDFSLVWKNLENAARFRTDNSLATSLGAQMVLIPENLNDVNVFCERAQAAGLDYVVIKPYSQHLKSESTKERGYEEFNYSRLGQLAQELTRWNSDKFHVVFRANTMRSLSETKRYYQNCHSTPNFWAYLMANGDLYGCSAYLLDERFRFGNLNDESFRDIWQGERRRQNYELVAKKLDISECRKNCRMEHINRYLWDLKNPPAHSNFI